MSNFGIYVGGIVLIIPTWNAQRRQRSGLELHKNWNLLWMVVKHLQGGVWKQSGHNNEINVLYAISKNSIIHISVIM